MNLVSLASHTVDLDLLPEAPIVLDAGCRWFDFTTALQIRRKDARVIAIDPAQDVVPPVMESRGALPFFTFHQAALVGTGRAQQRLAHFSTGEGDFLTTQGYFPGWDIQPKIYDVECFNIGELMLMHDIKHWDLVKLDIEGSEFGVLENWPGPVATQISVEFHDWDKPQYNGDYYDRLWKALPSYKVIQHNLSLQGSGMGHWDTLLTLR
jgi:FkbM family methyltransferase